MATGPRPDLFAQRRRPAGVKFLDQGFLTTSNWDTVAEQHGAFTAIYGPLVSALLPLLIARSSPSASAWCSA